MAGIADSAFKRIMELITEEPGTIELRCGSLAYVDKSDLPLLSHHKWRKSGTYAAARMDGHLVMMHRFLLGDCQKGHFIDHEDGDGLNNQRYNLRFCTHQENMRNRNRVSGVSKFKGVHFCKGAWRAQIAVGGKKINLGSFSNELKAAKAYDAAAPTYHGEFAKTNKQLGLY